MAETIASFREEFRINWMTEIGDFADRLFFRLRFSRFAFGFFSCDALLFQLSLTVGLFGRELFRI